MSEPNDDPKLGLAMEGSFDPKRKAPLVKSIYGRLECMFDSGYKALESILALQENLDHALTDSMGYAVGNVELAIEQVSRGRERLARAKSLCDRGMEQLKMLLFLTYGLRVFIRVHLEADSSQPSQRKSHEPADENRRSLEMDEVKRIHIKSVLDMCEGGRMKAAQILGIGRTSLYRFLKREEISAKENGVAASNTVSQIPQSRP